MQQSIVATQNNEGRLVAADKFLEKIPGFHGWGFEFLDALHNTGLENVAIQIDPGRLINFVCTNSIFVCIFCCSCTEIVVFSSPVNCSTCSCFCSKLIFCSLTKLIYHILTEA